MAFIFGAAFFFDLFWPARRESPAVRLAWKTCGVLAVVFHLSSALTLTIITASHCGYFRDSQDQGREPSYGKSLLEQFRKDGRTPLCYRHNSRAVTAVVFVWLGLASVVGSCVVLHMSLSHIGKNGPYSKHARKDVEKGHLPVDGAADSDQDIKPISPVQTTPETVPVAEKDRM